MLTKLTKTLLLNLLALVLLPHGVAVGQKPCSYDAAAAVPCPAVSQSNVVKVPAPANLDLTELQKARLDAARQEVFRWQDKMQEAAQKFVAICNEAGKENHWPEVQCGLNDLKVTPVPPPSPQPPAKAGEKP
jgi:hypothetical protein